MIIENDKLVSVVYQLKSDNAQGEVIETINEENPLKFLFGKGMLLPKFESNLDGKKTGDSFEFTLGATEAYGEYTKDAIIDVPLTVFEAEGKVNYDLVKVGNAIPMMDSNGNRLNGIVQEVADTIVKMDFNHPMAGKQLHFSGTVVDVKQPDEEDLAAFNPQGGCSGCSGGDCSDGGCQ
ncbi:MAG: FKBP-type peptidyl-prolyl cis-trans isomerase [Salinivirgaceae bacterium]|jgi:FKBP-type peptidyl-prolyl cis-trans isomerase SlyD|nr:FKBP-type peptidyl-prolyl cis-trans isomerase [Salinivirgaceae bacterium]